MRERRPGLVQEREVALRQVDAVAVDRARPGEAVAGVDVEIGRRVGKQRRDQCDLGQVLGHVRLHVDVRVLALQRAGGIELRQASTSPRSAA